MKNYKIWRVQCWRHFLDWTTISDFITHWISVLNLWLPSNKTIVQLQIFLHLYWKICFQHCTLCTFSYMLLKKKLYFCLPQMLRYPSWKFLFWESAVSAHLDNIKLYYGSNINIQNNKLGRWKKKQLNFKIAILKKKFFFLFFGFKNLCLLLKSAKIASYM